MVAARRATVQAGLDILSEGGNAVDAAVCMAFVAAVVEPTETSIGGSGFLMFDDPGGHGTVSVEFPPRAPLAARPDLEPRTRPGSSGALLPCVPGLVAGLGLAHQRFGSLGWDRLLEAAVGLAEDGFEVDEYLSLQTLAQLEPLRVDASAGSIFLRDGVPPVSQFAMRRPGHAAEVIRQPALASTLRTVASGGAEAFYRGPPARAMVAAVSGSGGLLRVDDLAGYRAVVCRPRHESYRGWQVFAPAGPCGGSAVLDALRRLEAFGAEAQPSTQVARLDQTARALRTAFAARRGDAGHGTTHLCVIDAGGRMVSCTTTLGETFGARFVAGETGVLLDSGLAWFDSSVPGNAIAGGGQPLVNMSPLLLHGPAGRRVAVGAAGGRRIISAVLQVVTSIVDQGLSVEDALDMPRLDASERQLRLSDRYPNETFEELRRLGHEVEPVTEEHAPYSFEFARPAAAETVPGRGLRGAIHPYATGYVAGR